MPCDQSPILSAGLDLPACGPFAHQPDRAHADDGSSGASTALSSTASSALTNRSFAANCSLPKAMILDSTRVAETARNLAALALYRRSTYPLARPSRWRIELTVSIEDLYSRALSPLISGQIDELSFGVVALDYNFRGRGQRLRLGLENRAISGPWAELLFAEPRLGNSRRALATQLATGAEGHAHALTFSRPFATLSRSSRLWPFHVQPTVHTALVLRRATCNALSRRTRRRPYLAEFTSYGEQTKVRPSVQLQVSRRRFTAISSDRYAPADRTRIMPNVGLLVWRPRYKRARYMRDLGPLEDLQTGSWLSLRWGFAHRSLGSDRTFSLYQARLAPRFEPTKRSYAELTLSASTHRGEGNFTTSSPRHPRPRTFGWE